MLEQPIFSTDALPIQPPPTLYGRQTELEQLRIQVKDGRMTWLDGVSGSGRRSLAATVASEMVNTAGGVLWLGVYYDNLLMLAGRISRAYGVAALSTDDLASQLEIVQALLAKNKPLIVIDGPISPTVIQQFGQRVRSVRLPVIIAGSPYKAGDWEVIHLGKLKDKDAESIYRHYSQVTPEVTRGAIIAPLLNYVEGHPLALMVAGIQVREKLMATSHFTSLLPETPTGAPYRTLGVYATAYSQLDSTAQGLLLLGGALFVDRVGLHLLSRVSGAPEKNLKPLMELLVKRGFCQAISQYDQPPIYRFHDLARIFARQMLKARQQLDGAYTRILRGIHQFIETHTEETSEANYDALVREMDHILGAAQFATSIQDRETVKSIFKMLGQHGTQNVIHARGYQSFYERLGQLLTGKPINYEEELAQVVESEAAPEPIEGKLIRETYQSPVPILANQPRARIAVEQLMSMSREALQGALNEAMGAQDDEAAAQLSFALGEWYTRHRQIGNALPNYQEAARLYQKADQPAQALRSLQGVIRACVELERAQEAIGYIQAALPLVSSQPDPTQHTTIKGQLLTLLGDAYARLGQFAEGIEAYTQAGDIYQATQDWLNTGLNLSKKAVILMDTAQLDSAVVVLAQAVDFFERAGRRDLQGRTLGNLGAAFGRLGRYREAGQRHMLALKLARETTDIEEERYQLMNLSFVSEAEGHLSWAIHYSRQALYLALVSSDREAMGEIAYTLGRLLLNDIPQLAQAIVLLQHAVDIGGQDDAVRLLNRAKTRHQRLTASGQTISPAETDLLRYTQTAYEQK